MATDGSQEINPFTGNDPTPPRRELLPAQPPRELFPPDNPAQTERDRKAVMLIRREMEALKQEMLQRYKNDGQNIVYLPSVNGDERIDCIFTPNSKDGSTRMFTIKSQRFIERNPFVSFTCHEVGDSEDSFELKMPVIVDKDYDQQPQEFVHDHAKILTNRTSYEIDSQGELVKKVIVWSSNNRFSQSVTAIEPDIEIMAAGVHELLERINPEKYPPPPKLNEVESEDEGPFTG